MSLPPSLSPAVILPYLGSLCLVSPLLVPPLSLSFHDSSLRIGFPCLSSFLSPPSGLPLSSRLPFFPHFPQFHLYALFFSLPFFFSPFHCKVFVFHALYSFLKCHESFTCHLLRLKTPLLLSSPFRNVCSACPCCRRVNPPYEAAS